MKHKRLLSSISKSPAARSSLVGRYKQSLDHHGKPNRKSKYQERGSVRKRERSIGATWAS